MKHIISMLAVILILSAMPVFAGHHEEEGATFVMHEYWQCGPANIAALQQTEKTVWGPIFDKRLIARHPENPRPWLYCDTLEIVTYGK